MLNVPSYADLRVRTDAPPGSSWGIFGPGDQLGTLNFLGPERIAAAARLVRTGRVFALDYPLDAFDPPPVRFRHLLQHHIFGVDPDHRDDWVDSLYLQAGSQIDGLRHMRHPEYGFYGGVPADRVGVGLPDLGIQLVAERGIVGRGVLLDVEPLGKDRITVSDLEATADACGVDLQPGDILLMHTGWAQRFLDLSPAERVTLGRRHTHDKADRERTRESIRTVHPGLEQSEETLAWLWDHQIAMVASDNLAVEALPVNPDSGLVETGDAHPATDSPHSGMMHRQWIALLGLALGELWRLEDLAVDCRRDGTYEFLLSAKPLNLVGGVGSPANALAVK